MLTFEGNSPQGTADVVFGEVEQIHIDDKFLTKDGKLDVLKIRPISRLGYYDYTSITDIFEMQIPQMEGLWQAALRDGPAGKDPYHREATDKGKLSIRICAFLLLGWLLNRPEMGIATPISFQQYFEKTLSGCGDDKEDGISGVATAQTQNIVENGVCQMLCTLIEIYSAIYRNPLLTAYRKSFTSKAISPY